jgi:hypothetical protein
MNGSLIVATIILCVAGAAEGALAAGLDGTAPVVCAASKTFDCASDGECVADAPEAINLPRLIRLDFAAKKAFTKRASGEERVAPISLQELQEGELILQGIQNGYGWSMAISLESGDMSLAITGGGAGMVVFGTCMGL